MVETDMCSHARFSVETLLITKILQKFNEYKTSMKKLQYWNPLLSKVVVYTYKVVGHGEQLNVD